jgi:8-oxo-dGTP pyrophosphatase MutT (NUDIX family)
MFTNTPNKKITHEGQDIYLSRSVAVVVICGDIINNDVVIVRRGSAMDYSGQYCLPCGYLDYDESAEQAAARELYEETGLIISPDNLKLLKVRSDPNASNLQNVSMIFSCDYADTKKSEHNPDVNEVDEVTWYKSLEETAIIAFGHAKLIDPLLIATHDTLTEFKQRVIATQNELDRQYQSLEERSTLTDEGKSFLFDFICDDEENFSWANYISEFGKTLKDLRVEDKFNQPL